MPCRFASLLFLALASPLAAAGIPADQDDGLEALSNVSPPWFAELQDVEIQDDRIYVYGIGGLAIYDISDLLAPVELGRYEPPGHPYDRFYRGAVSDTIAVGGGREDLLSIMTIADPAVPSLITLYGSAGRSYEGAVLRDGICYACVHADGLEIIDLTLPATPVSLAVVSGLVNAWDLELVGDLAYVADGLGGLAVVDVAVPSAPVHLTSIPTSGAAVDVVIHRTVAAVCNGSAGVDLFDLADPAAPSPLSTVNTSALAITAAFAGDTLYVADWDDVEAFDLSNPAAPTPAGGEDTPIRAMGLDARPGLVAVADWSRLRLYRPGPTTDADLHVPVEGIDFGMVPFGANVDTVITIGNTGGAPLNVSQIRDFDPQFTVDPAGPLTILPGQTVDLTIVFNHTEPGYDATFIRIDSDDPDEADVSFPVSGDDNPYLLDVGNPAPAWIHADTDGVVHHLPDYLGRVVVMAFFADW